MIRYLRMFRAFASTEFQFEMEYRANMYLSIFEMFLVIGTSIGAVLVMFGHTTTAPPMPRLRCMWRNRMPSRWCC